MSKRWFAILGLAAGLGLAVPAMAGTKGQGKGNAHKNEGAKYHQADRDNDHRWEHRDGFEYRVYGLRDSRPPGWIRGKKTGWRECGLQARRYGCYTYLHSGHRYFYYHDDEARIVVRRVVINVNVSAVR
jgi:hypothetical protein